MKRATSERIDATLDRRTPGLEEKRSLGLPCPRQAHCRQCPRPWKLSHGRAIRARTIQVGFRLPSFRVLGVRPARVEWPARIAQLCATEPLHYGAVDRRCPVEGAADHGLRLDVRTMPVAASSTTLV